MPKYNYIGKTLQGEPRSGTLEAKNQHQLARILRTEGCILISAESGEVKKEKRKFTISIPSLGWISLTEKIMFARNLRVMIAAGVPLPRGLEILANQSKKEKFKKILLNVRDEVIKGFIKAEVSLQSGMPSFATIAVLPSPSASLSIVLLLQSSLIPL